ncbi:MAG TPA: GIY-YIG nuclease family protein [Ohtaekwangia sp.]|nr:GIY-YIG nuclease family protein [Ohtaekwangia sp.]
MSAWIYILYSPSADRHFVGHTTEPVLERLRKHNSNHKGFTVKFNDWEIVYTELFQSKKFAFQREMQVKGWKSRKKIEDLIKRRSEHPD